MEYLIRKTKNGTATRTVIGRPVKVHPQLQTFIFDWNKQNEPPSKIPYNRWSVTEVKTGYSVATSATRKGAVELAKKRIENVGIKETLKIIKESLDIRTLTKRRGTK